DDAGDELHGQRERQGAPPHVAPTGPAGNPLVERLLQQPAITGPVVEPIEKRVHTTGTLCSWPGWKFWKRTHTSSPLRTSTSSGARGRGLGLAGSSRGRSRAERLRWDGHRKCGAPGATLTKRPACGHTTFRQLTSSSGVRRR